MDWRGVTQFEGPEESPGFLLWQVSTEWRREIEAVLAPLGLTHPQFVLLASLGWLTRNGSEVSQVELARYCRTDITVTSQVVRSLEGRGLIGRRPGSDGRAKYPHATEAGENLIRRALPLVEEADGRFFEELGGDNKRFIELLHRFVSKKRRNRG